MILTCIVVDDEPKAIEILQRYIKDVSNLLLTRTFRDPVEALSFFRTNPVDIVFLDINMPTLSGLEFSKIVGSNHSVIFTTAYPEYALQGFDLNATDYLLKPISFERFLQSVDKVARARALDPPADKTLFFKSGSRIFQTQTEEILFFEKKGNYFSVHLTGNRNILIRMNFAELTDYLPHEIFYRVHKSYIVAKRHITYIEGDMICIASHQIPIGLIYRQNLQQILPSGFFRK